MTTINPNNQSDSGHCGPNESCDKPRDLASSLSQTAHEMADQAGHKAHDLASSVAQKAQDTATAALDQTDQAIGAVGHQMTRLAGTLREAAPDESKIGSVATSVADQLQAGGRYLEENGLKDMKKDVTEVVRRYPLQSILLGVGIGCLLGMTLSRR